MPVYQLKSVQKIPSDLDTTWGFFANARNLPRITPDHLSLTFTNEIFGDEMYPGQIITYRVRPILHIPVFWMTEITTVETLKYFIDEQRHGPYKFWQHQHHFVAIEGGVEMTDIIYYSPPMGFLGTLANELFIRDKLRSIFKFRYARITEIFGNWPGQEMRLIFSR